MRLRGRFLTAATAVVCGAVLSACGAPARPAAAAAPAAARQFDLLVSSQNGYHYPPFLRERPAPPEAQSHALRTLTELDRAPRVRPAATRVASMRRDALASSPLWGRTWLIPLRRAGVEGALGPDDTRAVDRLRAEGGWYVDPALGDESDAARLGGTWAALDVLGALGELDDLPSPHRAATVGWLRSLAGSPRPVAERAALAHSLHLLRQPVPAALSDAAPPRTDDWQALTPDERADLLGQVHDDVLVREAAGQRPEIDRAHWEAVLTRGALSLPYEQLQPLVHILKAAGSPEKVFVPVIARLERARLGDGTVRDPDSYLGDPQSSLFVERLRGLAGWPRRDPGLLDALDREKDRSGTPQDSAERLSRAALAKAAGGGTDGRAARLCADPEVLPGAVTEHDVTRWQRTALDCVDAGAAVGTPEVRPWALDDPDAVAAAATLAVGLADTGQRHRIPPWITPRVLERRSHEPGRFASVYDYSLVVRAHLLLGGDLDAPLRAALGRVVTPHRGCPGLPDLFRVGGGDPACDLKTTWGVWTLDRQAHGALGWLPGRTDAAIETGERAEEP
ncbi:hypothetical protein [Streptomyces sp. NPDC005017]|uniref:hypothetical protein n=1 Tax=Streptomyces sp. NPDC005017 TaxID=3364706 RepID=UPI0036D053B9